MKHVFLAIFAVLLTFSFSPKPVFAALDCINSPTASECWCTTDTGDIQQLPNVTTELDCQTGCDDILAASFQFNYCKDNGDVQMGANTSLANLTTYESCTTNPADFLCECNIPVYSWARKPVGPVTENECITACGDDGLMSFKCIVAPTTPFVPPPGDVPVDATKPSVPVIPILNVPIPGLDLTGAVSKNGGVVTSSLISLYIQAAYRFLLVAGSLMAIVMLMVGGLEYVIAGGSSKRVEKAKTRIKNAIMGLILLFAAFDLAFLISPQTVAFVPLKIESIKKLETIELEEDPETLAQNPPDASIPNDPNVTTISGPHLIVNTANNRVGKEVLDKLNVAAGIYFAQTGKNIQVTSASRDVSVQARLFFERFMAPGSPHKPSTCDPTGSTYGRSTVVSYANRTFTATGMLLGVTDPATGTNILTSNGQARNCPHTSNVAVDIFPEGSPGDFIANVKDMTTMNQIMTANGFCRLTSEAWHYELDGKQLSKRSCTTANSTPIVSGHNPAGCFEYDFKDYCCMKDDSADSKEYSPMCN